MDYYDKNLLHDPTGANVMKYQPHRTDDVYFLPGAPFDSMTRNVSIPIGKIILLPVMEYLFYCIKCSIIDQLFQNDLKNRLIDEGGGSIEENAVHLEARLDGKPIPYKRVTSDMFDLNLKVPGGNQTYPAVTDGYHVMINTTNLDTGKHVLYTHGKDKNGYHTEITYNIHLQ